MTNMTHAFFLMSCLLFILSIRFLSSPKTAYKGNILGIFGMLFSLIAGFVMLKNSALLAPFLIIIFGALTGILLSAKTKITSLPQMIALLNGSGGLSAMLISLANSDMLTFSNFFGLFIGGITFSGSVIAFMKLQNLISAKPFKLPYQKIVIFSLLLLIIGLSIVFATTGSTKILFCLCLCIILFGIIFVLPIGGADMPVAISVLNAFSGWATVAVGLSFQIVILIIIGTIVGSSGSILAFIMTKSMNRSLINIFTGQLSSQQQPSDFSNSTARSGSPADAAFIMENAAKIIIVPGFGMAAAQAQYALKDMSEILENKYNVDVKFAIHPVAGRMPGHMNVLLAEASIDYNKIFDLNSINNEFSTADVAYVIGANDITNPLAKTDTSSPIYGMPILEVSKAKHIFFVKRSLSEGYSGVPNPLFYASNTTMLYGDAKAITEQIISYLEKP